MGLYQPPTQAEQATLTQRAKWAAMPVPFDICVGTGPANFKDINQLVKQSRTASLHIDLKPGTGNSVHGRFRNPDEPDVRGVLCASTAKVLALQTVLELCLIFYGVRLKPMDGDCVHALDGVCPLDMTASVATAQFTRFGLLQASLPTEEQAQAAEWSSPQDIQLEHLNQDLWSFVDPSKCEWCVVYIQLKEFPAPKLDLPRSTLVSRLLRMQGKREGKSHPPLVVGQNQARHEGQSRGKDVTENRGLEPEQPRKKRRLTDSTAAHNGTAVIEDSAANQTNNTNGSRATDFRRRVLEIARKRHLEHCAVLREQYPLEAAHLIPRSMNPALMDPILQAVFTGRMERINAALTPEQRRCLPLFAPKHYPYPSNWTDMDDPDHNALLINPTVHSIMDGRLNLLIVRAKLFVVGELMSRTELSCYDPPCPTIQMHNITRETVQDPQFKVAQIRHESAVKPFTVDAKIQTWALLHLRSAASFYCWFMEGEPSTISLLSSLTSDFTLPPATTENSGPGRDVRTDAASSGGSTWPQHSSRRPSSAKQLDKDTMSTSDPFLQYVDELFGKIFDEGANLDWIFAQATSALNQAGSAGGLDSSFIQSQFSVLDQASSSAFAALSSAGTIGSSLAGDASSLLNTASSQVASAASSAGTGLSSIISQASTNFNSIASSISTAANSASSSKTIAGINISGAGQGYALDMPISLAITAAAGLFAAVLIL
ncbi:hypothetical protein CF319_g962 [Tilletia indica]|nr:hypothetical protein CF319_g962 [Tilletia indica]